MAKRWRNRESKVDRYERILAIGIAWTAMSQLTVLWELRSGADPELAAVMGFGGILVVVVAFALLRKSRADGQ